MTVSTHTYTATLSGAPPVSLGIKGGRVFLDASKYPHVSATIEVAIPDPALLLQLDPRAGRRVTVHAQATFPTFSQDRIFDLGIRRMQPSRANGDATLTLASDEALLGDYAPLVLDVGARAYEASLRGVCNYVLGKIGAHLEAGTEDANVTAYWAVTNQVVNPRAALTATGWQLGSGSSALARTTMAAPLPPVGTTAIQWTAAVGTSNIVPIAVGTSRMRVEAGKWYVFSAYLCSGTARNAQAAVQFWAVGGVSAAATAYGAVVASDATAFRRVSVIAQCPPGATEAVPFITTLANTAGNLHYASCAQWYEGRELIPYYDGATAAGGGYTYEWQDPASPHASASTRKPNIERPPALFEWQPGVSAMDFLAPLVQANGYRLVCDGDRKWTLRGADHTEPGSISIRHGVNLIDAAEEASRDGDDWYDGAVFRYTWTDENGIEQTRDDIYTLPGATKIILRKINAVYPGPGRAQYAVQRAKGKGRTLDVTAVADWSAVCDEVLTVMFEADEYTWTEQRRNYITNSAMVNSTTGWFAASGAVFTPTANGTQIDWASGTTAGVVQMIGTQRPVAAPNDPWSESLEVTVPAGYPPLTMLLHLVAYNASSGTLSPRGVGTAVTINPGTTQTLTASLASAPAGTASVSLYFYASTAIPAGARAVVRRASMEKTPTNGGYFDGGTVSPSPELRYRWLGTVNASASVEERRNPVQGVHAGTAEAIEYDLTTDRMTIHSRTIDVPAGAIDLLPGTIDALPGTIDSLT